MALRKLLLILSVFFCLQSEGQTPMRLLTKKATTGITFIDHVVAGSPNGDTFTTGSINTTGATLIVIAVSSYSAAGAPTISDSKGNTWTALTAKVNATAAVRTQLYYCYSPTGGSGHTFTATGFGYASIHAFAFSGTTGTFDVENGTTGGTSPQSAGAITPALNGEVIIAALGENSLSSASVTSGFTNYDIAYASGQHFALSMAYYIQPAAGSQDCTFTWSGGGNGSVVIAAFK